jgi:hypothetical protein
MQSATARKLENIQSNGPEKRLCPAFYHITLVRHWEPIEVTARQ